MDSRANEILSFLKEISKFKHIEREIYLPEINRKESDAEHSWHLAMFLILFEKELPKQMSLIKALKFALIHDLVEIYAGDTFAFDKTNRKTKKERELAAAKKLFSQLPADLEEEFASLFEEYENNDSSEAKIVHSFDKIQPILQNISSDGWSWKKHKVTYEDLDSYKRKYMEHNAFLLKIYESILEEARNKKLI